MLYRQVKVRERLPEKTAYYAIETDRIYGHVHWSIEKQVWTLEHGQILEATYPNCWYDPVKEPTDEEIENKMKDLRGSQYRQGFFIGYKQALKDLKGEK